MSKLTADDEQTLLESVKQAVHYVDEENMSPNDAIIKVARDMSLSPGFVRASVNAFNNGRQVSQWNANDSALDKLAEFQMADYDAVHREIWGKTEKEAHDTYTSLGDDVHSDYSKAPQWAKRDSLSKLATLDLGIEKKAEDEVSEHVRQHEATKQANSVWDAYARAKRSCEDARVKESAAKDVLTTRLALLTNYFKKFAYDRLPFDVVDKAAQSYYGGKGVALMDIMSDRFPKEKRAADTKRYWDKPLSKDAEPFTFIVNAIKAAADLSSASNALGMAKQAQEEAKGTLLPFVPTPTQPKSEKDTTFSISLIDGGDGEKQAKMRAGLLTGAIIGGGAKPAMEALTGGTGVDERVEKVLGQLSSPAHDDELRKIQAQVMLTEMMSDPDNPISEYNPEAVLQAYNDITRLAPRLSEQPAAMQPLLAKRLAGNIEPFEIKEIGEIERGLQQTSSAPDIMKQSNDSILV